MKQQRKKKGIYVKQSADIERRKSIQAMAWDKGMNAEKIAIIMGLNATYIRQITSRKECECGEPVARGSRTCARCEHLEANQQLYSRSTCGTKDKDMEFEAFRLPQTIAACSKFLASRAIT